MAKTILDIFRKILGKRMAVFLCSMIPIIELRGAIPLGAGLGLPWWQNYILCVIGNMLPVPFIYFFARKVLIWGSDKKHIGNLFQKILEKGEHGGQKLVKRSGRGGLFVALMLFVGIPLPGTGAWTGTLAASFLNMGIKSTAASVSLGVLIAGTIMYLASNGFFSIIGL